MKNLPCFFTLIFFLSLTVICHSQDVIFLHHSTGGAVYSTGGVASWISSYNIAYGKSIHVTERSYPNSPWPWENYPYDYWKLWVDGSCSSDDIDIECLNTLESNYDLVIFKHCFPGAAILANTGSPDVSSGVKRIENYQAQYRALRALFDSYPNTKFMVWTLAPLHRLATTSEAAQRANEFVQWVKNEWLVEDGKPHSNILIFDFYGLVAELDQNPVNGVRYCLKYGYEASHTSSDSHPNTVANQYVGPIFAQAIADAFVSTLIPVTGITVTGAGGATTITTDNGTLQLSAAVLPSNATNKTVTWSVTNGTGQATVNSTGLLTAVANGTVTARATANDGSAVYGTLTVTLSNQVIPVTGITVTGAGGAATITTDNGTLQLSAAVLPSNATNKTVTWSVTNGTGQATVNSAGLLTAVANGTVTARATANDGSAVYGTLTVTLSNQVVPVTGITVTGAGGANFITSIGGTLQLNAAVLPADASDKTVTWSLANGTDKAAVSAAGLLTAVSNGIVTVKAAANDGSGVFGTLDITISNQIIPVDNITVFNADGITAITSEGGTLQLNAMVLPADATDKTITWSVFNESGQATVDSTGLVTAVSDGTVIVTASANDGSEATGSVEITVAEQAVLVESIHVIPSDVILPVIKEKNGRLQMEADIIPTDATVYSVNWTVENHSGMATVNDSGLVTGMADGSVKVIAKAKDGSYKSGFCMVAITNQSEATSVIEKGIPDFHVIQLYNKLIINTLNKDVIPEHFDFYSVQGILLQKGKVMNDKIEIDISAYTPGIYIVTLSDGRQTFPLKISLY